MTAQHMGSFYFIFARQNLHTRKLRSRYLPIPRWTADSKAIVASADAISTFLK